MKKILLAFFTILFFAQVNAIAIIAPTVYVISVSILGLIANLVISAIAFIAIQGFASKTFAGKSLYKIIKFFYTILGKVSIYAISLSIGIFISAPFDMNTSINSGIIAAGISFAVLALFHSRELVLDGKKLKHFKAIALFSIFVLVAGSATSFFSLKVEEIQTEKSFFEIVGKNLWSAQSIAQETNQISAPQSMEESSDYRTLQKTSEPQPEQKIIYPSLWFLPKNLEKCTIEIGYQKFEFEAKQNCASNSNEEIAPEFCPIELKREQVIAEEGIAEISVSGSCSGKAKVFITQNGFTDFTKEG